MLSAVKTALSAVYMGTVGRMVRVDRQTAYANSVANAIQAIHTQQVLLTGFTLLEYHAKRTSDITWVRQAGRTAMYLRMKMEKEQSSLSTKENGDKNGACNETEYEGHHYTSHHGWR